MCKVLAGDLRESFSYETYLESSDLSISIAFDVQYPFRADSFATMWEIFDFFVHSLCV